MRNHYISKPLTLWVLLALSYSAAADQNNWTGAGGDMLWTNSANWSLGVLPDSTQDVFIDNTGTNAVVLNAPAEAANFSVGSNAVFNLAGDLTVQTNVTVGGTLDWSSGAFSVINRTVVSPSGTWIIRATAPSTLRGTNVNNGTISCFASHLSGSFYLCQITNGNLFVIHTNLTVDGLSRESGFLNGGTLLVPAGNSNLTLTAACTFNNNGTIRVETNSSLTMRQGLAESLGFGSGTVFEGAGLIRLTDGKGPFALDALSCGGNITVNGTVELGGGRIWGSPGGVYEGVYYPATSWSGSGLLRWPAGSLFFFTFATNFNVEISGTNNKTMGGACTNYGTIRWTSAASLLADYTVGIPGMPTGVYNQGEFILETNCTLEGQFSNVGTLRVPAGRGAVKLAMGIDFQNAGMLVAETNSSLDLEGNFGSAAFNPGSTFDGAGVVRFLGGTDYPHITCQGNMLVNGTVEVAGGTLFSAGAWTGSGLLRWTGGALANFIFDINFNVEISGPETKGLSLGGTNWGTMYWRSTGPMTRGAFGSGSLFNFGQLILETNCTFSDCSFYNEGIVRVPADYGAITLTNLGPADFNNSSQLVAETNSIFALAGLFSLNEGTVFQGPGIFRMLRYSQDVDILGWGNIAVNTTVELAGATLGFGYWTGPGILRFLAGNLGSVTIAPDFHVEVSGTDDKKLGGVCTNLGSFHVQGCSLNGPGWGWGATQFYNAGLFTVDDTGAWDVGGFVNLSTGIFRQTNGQFTLGSIDNAGTIEVKELNTTAQIFNTNSLTVNGHLNVGGAFYNAGSLKLDGKVHANDGFQQYPSASLEMLLHGEDTSATQLSAPGFVFGGSLTASLVNGFTPTNGSVFMIVTNFGQRWEEFSTVTLPSLPAGLVWRISNQTQSPQSVALVVTTPTSVTNATVLPNGSFQFTLTGSAGGAYEIQASTNLVDWTTLTNAPFGGSATFTDTTATNFTRRFYRGVIGD